MKVSLSVVTITWGQELSELPKRLVYQVVISQDSVQHTIGIIDIMLPCLLGPYCFDI
jgi:hypothetical protein